MRMTQDASQPVLMERLDAAMQTVNARPWLIRWLVLAMIVLGTAGLFAVPLALGRAPGVSDLFPWFVANFHRFLVVHVDYSFVVFFLTVFAAVQHIAAFRLGSGNRGGQPKLQVLEYIAFRGTVIGVAGMLIPVFIAPSGEPIMSNYVPVITSATFYAALLILGVSFALMSVWVLINWPGQPKDQHGRGVDILTLSGVAGSVIYLAAFAMFLAAWALLQDVAQGHQLNEELFWAGGHVLQFINVAVLIAAWYAVGSATLKRIPFNPMIAVASIALLLAAALASALFWVLWEPFSGIWRLAYTNLQYVFGPLTLIAALALYGRVAKAGPLPWKNAGFVALMLSPIVFGIGGAMGLFVDGLDTRTPAHYHAMIAGVTLAFMGLIFAVLLPLLNRPVDRPRMALTAVWMFGISQSLASTGLFIAGGHGAARKVAGDAQGLDVFAAKFGMGLNGGGGLLAIIGGALFVWVVARALIVKR